MPLLRYNLEDNVEVSDEPCPCGWQLPTVRVLGRSSFGHRVGSATVTQARLEELVFGLPVEHGVMFWRARARADLLELEIEVAPEHREAARTALAAAIEAEYGPVAARIDGVPPGSLVPLEALTGVHDVVKPRSLFGPDEDWSKALLYY